MRHDLDYSSSRWIAIISHNICKYCEHKEAKNSSCSELDVKEGKLNSAFLINLSKSKNGVCSAIRFLQRCVKSDIVSIVGQELVLWCENEEQCLYRLAYLWLQWWQKCSSWWEGWVDNRAVNLLMRKCESKAMFWLFHDLNNLASIEGLGALTRHRNNSLLHCGPCPQTTSKSQWAVPNKCH